MKIIKTINTFAILIPIILGLYGIIINDAAGDYISYALYSTMITGLFQVIVGLFMLYKDKNNVKLQIYISSVIIFFMLWYFYMNIFYSDFLTFFLFPIPLLLAIYLSVIIYTNKTS